MKIFNRYILQGRKGNDATKHVLMEFAIVDIETTGGYAAGSGITEIAIIIHDGEKVLDRFETLINPWRPIPLPIQLLTGISDDMVAASPAFSDIAEQVFQMLSGRIFVAHNVNFDYSFIRHQLEQEGYTYTASKLCTVRLSRKIKPGLRSYSLGRLCTALDIPLENHHRAGGDADATAILFAQLHALDHEGHIDAMLKRNSGEQLLPPNLPKEDFERLPRCPGVYYFRDQAGKVIYVGKARDIRKRVASHFTGHNPNPQRQNFLRNIFSIDHEPCGTELMAFLLEAAEIKRLWPQYNRAMKRQDPRFGLYVYEDLNGYTRLAIGKYNKYQQGLHVFHREHEGRNLLHGLVHHFGLCPELCMLGACREGLEEGHTEGCAALQPAALYNEKVNAALEDFTRHLPSFVLLDKGRHEGEKSCIWVERGHFYGMGYIDAHTDMQYPEEIRSLMTRYTGNAYMIQLIHTYAQKHPHKVIHFEPDMLQGQNNDAEADTGLWLQ